MMQCKYHAALRHVVWGGGMEKGGQKEKKEKEMQYAVIPR